MEAAIAPVLPALQCKLHLSYTRICIFLPGTTALVSTFDHLQVKGVFNGAALVFYSYIGFDSVACSAEEVRRPSRDLPLGILGALGIVTVCYMLMSAVLVSRGCVLFVLIEV